MGSTLDCINHLSRYCKMLYNPAVTWQGTVHQINPKSLHSLKLMLLNVHILQYCLLHTEGTQHCIYLYKIKYYIIIITIVIAVDPPG